MYRPSFMCLSTNQPATNTAAINSTGTGTPSTRFLPKNPKLAGRLPIERPPVAINARPRQIVSIAKVVTNGGTRNWATITPFTSPTKAPIARATNAPRITPVVFAFWLASIAATTPHSAATEPTDRSMPPVKITAVIPTERIPVIAMLNATLIRFGTERNCGAMMAKTKDSTMIATTITYSAIRCHCKYRVRKLSSGALTISLIDRLYKSLLLCVRRIDDFHGDGDLFLRLASGQITVDGIDGFSAQITRLLSHVSFERAASLDCLDCFSSRVVSHDDEIRSTACFGCR